LSALILSVLPLEELGVTNIRIIMSFAKGHRFGRCERPKEVTLAPGVIFEML
jgi:hypothetical protein